MRLKTFCEDIGDRGYMDEEVNTFCSNIEQSDGKIINIKTESLMDDKRIYAVVSVVYKERKDK